MQILNILVKFCKNKNVAQIFTNQPVKSVTDATSLVNDHTPNSRLLTRLLINRNMRVAM